MGFQAVAFDHQDLAGLDVTHVGGIDQIEGAGFGSKHEPIVDPSHAQRPEAARITGDEEEGRRQHHQGVSALDEVEHFGERFEKRAPLGTAQQVQDDFAVAGGVENGAVALQFPPQGAGVHQVAVVCQRNRSTPPFNQDRLRVGNGALPRCRIAHVPDGGITVEQLQALGIENLGDMPHPFLLVELPVVRTDDSGGFLTPVLQRVQAKIGQPRRFRVSDYSENSALLVKPELRHAPPKSRRPVFRPTPSHPRHQGR